MFRGTLAASILSLASAAAAAQVATPAMVGHWKGEAGIFSSWTTVRTLTVDIRIAANDKVTGKIGDATLVNGRLVSNRGWFGRTIRIKTDYRILAELEGRIIAAEGVLRSSVSLPLNWVDGRFQGSVATSGTDFGGAESGILTAGHLTLQRVPDMIVCQAGDAIQRLWPPPTSGVPARKNH